MASTRLDRKTRVSSPAETPGGAARARYPWVRFFAGLSAILLFAFGVVPAVQRWGPVHKVRDAIQNRGIDAGALFYTESDVSFEAETSTRDAVRFAPCRPSRGRPATQDAENRADPTER